MRNIRVCHDVGTIFIDRDGTTVLVELPWGPGWCNNIVTTVLSMVFYAWISLDEEPWVNYTWSSYFSFFFLINIANHDLKIDILL